MDITELAMMKAIAGGLETIELTTTVGAVGANNTPLTSEESAILTEAWNKGKPVIIKCPLDLGTLKFAEFAGLAMLGKTTGSDIDLAMLAISFGSLMIQFGSVLFDGHPDTWFYMSQKV